MADFLKTLSSVGSAVSSIANPISTLVGGLSSLFGSKGVSQRDQMKWQEQMLDKQLGFNATQSELSRDWQASQAEISRSWNSIGAQLKRAEAAGVNPYSLVGSGQYGSAGSSPTPSGATASVAGSIPSPAPNTSLQRAQAFNAVASGLQQLASAKERGVNTSYVERGMNDLLRKLSLEADGKELMNNFQRVVNKYSDKIQRRTADKLFNEIQLIASQDFKNYQDILESKARIIHYLALSGVAKAQAKRELKFIDEYADEIWSSEIEANRASASSDYAHASESRQRTRNLSQEHELNELGLRVARATNEAEQKAAHRQFVEAAEQYGIITDQMRTNLEIALKNKDWYTYDKIIQGISSLAGAYGNISSGTSSLMRPRLPANKHSVRRSETRNGRKVEYYDDWYD